MKGEFDREKAEELLKNKKNYPTLPETRV